jgi:hypothetical protein
METEQMMARLLAEIRTGQVHMKEMMDAIARQQFRKQVHACAVTSRNNTVEVFSLCPSMDRWYATRSP